MCVLDTYIVPDEVGHSWPALGIKSGLPGNLGNGKKIHDNKMVWMPPISG